MMPVAPAENNLSKVIIGVAIALASLTVLGILVFGGLGFKPTELLVELPWLLPTAQAFVILSAFAIAFLCYGRFRALGGAWVYWTSVIFLANGILGVFYLLSWPGLLGDRGLIARLPNTSSWLFFLFLLAIPLLLVAVNARQPERFKSSYVFTGYAIAAVLSFLAGLLSVLFEDFLPVFVVDSAYVPWVLMLVVGIIVVSLVAAVAAHLRFLKERDVMLDYVALFLVLMAFEMLDSIIAGRRYDFWWYVSRLDLIAAYVVMLFGLLQEGYVLFGRERMMAVERERLLKEVRVARDQLETRVKERTTDLEEANKRLQGEIAERRRVEEALRESEERFRVITAHSPDNMFFQDRDLRYTWIFNPASPVAVEQVLGKTDFDLLPKDEAEQATEIKKKVLQTGTGTRVELTLSPGGISRWYETVYEPLLDREGRIIGIAGYSREITERKRAEKERERLLQETQRRAAELDVANKELQSFAYTLAHDLRSPLRHIDGFSRILLRDYSDRPLDERGKEYLQSLRTNTQRMGQLIDDLLNLSRVTRAEMHRQTVDLSEIARSIVADLRKQQPERQAEILIAPGMIANADPDLMRLALQHLLGNAWKFTSPRPVARIEFGVLPMEGQREGKPVLLDLEKGEGPVLPYLSKGEGPVYFVRDNGVGFDMAYAGKLFEPFGRLHKRGQFPGTGIGLAIVSRIIRRHGGEVWGEGAVDQGATFYFTLG